MEGSLDQPAMELDENARRFLEAKQLSLVPLLEWRGDGMVGFRKPLRHLEYWLCLEPTDSYRWLVKLRETKVQQVTVRVQPSFQWVEVAESGSESETQRSSRDRFMGSELEAEERSLESVSLLRDDGDVVTSVCRHGVSASSSDNRNCFGGSNTMNGTERELGSEQAHSAMKLVDKDNVDIDEAFDTALAVFNQFGPASLPGKGHSHACGGQSGDLELMLSESNALSSREEQQNTCQLGLLDDVTQYEEMPFAQSHRSEPVGSDESGDCEGFDISDVSYLRLDSDIEAEQHGNNSDYLSQFLPPDLCVKESTDHEDEMGGVISAINNEILQPDSSAGDSSAVVSSGASDSHSSSAITTNSQLDSVCDGMEDVAIDKNQVAKGIDICDATVSGKVDIDTADSKARFEEELGGATNLNEDVDLFSQHDKTRDLFEKEELVTIAARSNENSEAVSQAMADDEELPIPKKGYNLDFLDNLDDVNFNPFQTRSTVVNDESVNNNVDAKPLPTRKKPPKTQVTFQTPARPSAEKPAAETVPPSEPLASSVTQQPQPAASEQKPAENAAEKGGDISGVSSPEDSFKDAEDSTLSQAQPAAAETASSEQPLSQSAVSVQDAVDKLLLSDACPTEMTDTVTQPSPVGKTSPSSKKSKKAKPKVEKSPSPPPPSSPPLARGSYNLNFDDLDEFSDPFSSKNPFGTSNKVTLSSSPPLPTPASVEPVVNGDAEQEADRQIEAFETPEKLKKVSPKKKTTKASPNVRNRVPPQPVALEVDVKSDVVSDVKFEVPNEVSDDVMMHSTDSGVAVSPVDQMPPPPAPVAIARGQNIDDVIDESNEEFVDANGDMFEAPPEVFNDPSTWEMLEKYGNSAPNIKDSALARQSLYVKFDPLVNAPSPKRGNAKARLAGIQEHANNVTLGEADLLVMNTPPPKSRGAAHPAVRALAHAQNADAEADGLDTTVRPVDKLLACSPPSEERQPKRPQAQWMLHNQSNSWLDKVSEYGEMDGSTSSCFMSTDSLDFSVISAQTSGDHSGKNGASPPRPCESLNNNATDIVQVLKYSQSDMDKMAAEMRKSLKMEHQGEMLKKERQCEELRASMEKHKKDNEAMKDIVAEYERTLLEAIAQKETVSAQHTDEVTTLTKERDQALEDLQGVETSFSDLYRRFEKARGVIVVNKQNEEKLKAALAQHEEAQTRHNERYRALRLHAEDKLQQASEEIERLKSDAGMAKTKLEARVKKLELQVEGLQQQIDQKTKENSELTAICDDLIGKVGGK